MKKGQGWLLFAFFMLFIAGIDHIIWGVAALTRKTFFTPKLLFANFTVWGVFWIVIGAVTVAASFAILNKSQWARWFGIIMATIGAVGMFSVAWTYPLWSAIIIAFDVMVIYGLLTYAGTEAEEETP